MLRKIISIWRTSIIHVQHIDVIEGFKQVRAQMKLYDYVMVNNPEEQQVHEIMKLLGRFRDLLGIYRELYDKLF